MGQENYPRDMDTAQKVLVNYNPMEIPVVPLVTVSNLRPTEDQGPRRTNRISRVFDAGSEDNTPPRMHAIKRTSTNIMQPKN